MPRELRNGTAQHALSRAAVAENMPTKDVLPRILARPTLSMRDTGCPAAINNTPQECQNVPLEVVSVGSEIATTLSTSSALLLIRIKKSCPWNTTRCFFLPGHEHVQVRVNVFSLRTVSCAIRKRQQGNPTSC